MTSISAKVGDLLSPTSGGDRIMSLDVIRGVALLGILLMNIAGFGLPGPAYGEPYELTGGSEGWNFNVWWINTMFFEGTMRGLFSMLFGAGALIFISRAESKGLGIKAADLYYRRVIWLIFFGIIHAYVLLWYGEILFHYGIYGLFLFPMRNLKAKTLIIAGLVLFLGLTGLATKNYLVAKHEHQAMVLAVEKQDAGTELTEEEEGAISAWEESESKPDSATIAGKIADRTGPYHMILWNMASINRFMQSSLTYDLFFWDILGMMLLGMALFKLNVFQASRSYRDYLIMMAIGYAVGIGINYYEIETLVNGEFGRLATAQAEISYGAGRLFMVMGHIGLIVIFVKLGILKFLQRGLAAVGRMALTNYVMDSIICNTIFLLFDQFGQWQRYELYYLVAGIWAFQLIMSPIWLKYFRFGPLEWLWRSLTYKERQPFKKTA